MKKKIIEVEIFERTVVVYFGNDYKWLYKEYPTLPKNLTQQGGACFSRENRAGEYHHVIMIDANEEFKKTDWIGKTRLFTHEICHCVHDICNTIGVEDTETEAYMTDWILGKLLNAFDFKKNKLKEGKQ